MAGQGGAAGFSLGRSLAPPRFLAFLVLLVGATIGWHSLEGGKWSDALTIGFDIAAAAFLLSLLPLLRKHTPDEIRQQARRNDANRVLVLVLTLAVVLVVLGSIAGELPDAARGEPWAIARLLTALGLAWLFSNAVYALHYAHLYYGESPDDPDKDCRGLDFPGDDTPDYSDFLYFAVTLGMTFQTSDVSITARHMRRVALGECMAAFVFNLGVIGLVINGLGGLAG